MTDAKESRHAVLRVAQHHPHALPDARQGRQPRQGRPVAVGVPRHDVRPRRAGRRRARLPRRGRARREHDRHVLHRQRSAHEHLARRRHDAVPQREELQLGGRLPGAGHGALARPHPAGQVLNGIVSHNDWFVTLLAAAGDTDVADRLKAGTDLGGTTYKVHLDGYNQLDYITGPADESPRQHFFYVSDDGDLTALRYDNWKFVFLEQRARDLRASGPSPTSSCGPPRSSTCGPTPTSGPTSRRTPTTTGCSTTSWLLIPAQAVRRPDAPDLPGVPTSPGAGQLQHRQGPGEAQGRRAQRLSRSRLVPYHRRVRHRVDGDGHGQH